MSQNDNNKPASTPSPQTGVPLPTATPTKYAQHNPLAAAFAAIGHTAPAVLPAVVAPQVTIPVSQAADLSEEDDEEEEVEMKAPAVGESNVHSMMVKGKAPISQVVGKVPAAVIKSVSSMPVSQARVHAPRLPQSYSITNEKVMIKIGDRELPFPVRFMLPFVDTGKADPHRFNKFTLAVPKGADGKFLKPSIVAEEFLRKLAMNLENGLELAKFIAVVPTENLEICVQALIDIHFKLPEGFPILSQGATKKKETQGALSSASDVIELLKERIAICTDEELLPLLAAQYPWYIEASRRAVTLAHVSEQGLQPAVIKFIAHLCKNRPDLAFMLSPTTLHDNTLVDPRVARFFTCDPYARSALTGSHPVVIPDYAVGSEAVSQMLTTAAAAVTKGKEEVAALRMAGSYGQVVSDKTLELFCKERAVQHFSRELANKRMLEVTKGIRTKAGFFPWFHPQRPNTGVLLAGGLPCAATLEESQWQAILDGGSDIDLFVYADTDEDRKAMVELLLRHFEGLGGQLEHFKSVFQIKGLGRDVQVICPFARSPLGVLINFDHTCIQIGYQEDNYKGQIEINWYATPGHCFFTPRGESFITRYNVRLFRMKKLLLRGFVPVSDNRGHLLYPHKTYFSPLWQLEIVGKATRGETWVEDRARASYVQKKGLSVKWLVKELGNEYRDGNRTAALRRLKITDIGLFADETVFWEAKAKEQDEKERTVVRIIDCRPETALSSMPRMALVDASGKALPAFDSKVAHTDSVPSCKTEIDWTPTTAAEAMATFHPEGATLSNGFDIYTAGVNATLPLPEDGETDNIYLHSFLLRNVRFVSPKAKVNLAAPQEEPLFAQRKDLPDPSKEYPLQRWQRNNKEDAREIEGIFVFGVQKTVEEVETELKEKREKEAVRIARLKQVRFEKARELIAESAGISIAEVDAEQATAIATQKRPFFERYAEKNVSEGMKKTVAHTAGINFKDLHSQLAEKTALATVDVWELPLMIKAFAEGKSYLCARKRTIKKKQGMVRVRAPVTIEDALVFDVDDLLAPLSSLDAFPGRRYNVVVRLMNLERWILKAHSHEDLVLGYGDRKVLHDLLTAKLADPEFNPTSELDGQGKMKVSDFMRAVRHVANLEKMEEECRKKVCRKPHAHKGLPGQMPVLFCTRFYVSKHNATVLPLPKGK